MSTSRREQGSSSDTDLLKAIQIVCGEVAAWLEQRPELRDAARTIFDSILADRSRIIAQAADSASEETAADAIALPIESHVTDSQTDESRINESRINKSLSAELNSTNVRQDIVQTIDILASTIAAEIRDASNLEDTVFEAVGINDDLECVRTTKPRYSEVSDADLSTMIDRCRLKAEGARWAIQRDERIREGADFKLDVKPHDLQIIDRAKHVANCFLWMNQPRADIRSKSLDFRRIADCFDALAETLVTLNVALATDDTELFLESVQLIAEAQSALRCAVSKVEDHPDTDQQLAYHWLRNRASKDRFYISRFMKITDPADPGNCLNVQQKAIELRSQATVARPSRQRGSWLEKARFHLRKIASNLESTNEYDWLKVGDAIDQWIDEGGSIRSRELRDILLPLVDDIPDVEFPANFERVIDVLISTSIPNNVPRINVSMLAKPVVDTDSEQSESTELASDRSLEVKQASNWLGGKRLALFAGEFDADLNDQIVRSFRLRSLDWIPPEEHHAEIEEHAETVDVIAILVTNQWETLLWDEVSEFAGRCGVPCVRLPSNCNPHQIAVQIIKQCPDKLSGGDVQSSVA